MAEPTPKEVILIREEIQWTPIIKIEIERALKVVKRNTTLGEDSLLMLV
jgi:hypothetical protein